MPIEEINYEPRADRVVVRRMPKPEPKPGEVIVPNSQQKEPNEGTVIAVGPGARNRVTGLIDKINLEVGDQVLFGDYAGNEIEVDGAKYLSLREEEIHGRRLNKSAA